MGFYRENVIKAVRKERRCYGCSRTIVVGAPAVDCAGNYDGEFWSATYHDDCRKAEVALNDLHDSYLDEWMNLDADMEWEDWPWLIDTFPTVAERMGITKERHDKIAGQQARVRQALRAREAQP